MEDMQDLVSQGGVAELTEAERQKDLGFMEDFGKAAVGTLLNGPAASTFRWADRTFFSKPDAERTPVQMPEQGTKEYSNFVQQLMNAGIPLDSIASLSEGASWGDIEDELYRINVRKHNETLSSRSLAGTIVGAMGDPSTLGAAGLVKGAALTSAKLAKSAEAANKYSKAAGTAIGAAEGYVWAKAEEIDVGGPGYKLNSLAELAEIGIGAFAGRLAGALSPKELEHIQEVKAALQSRDYEAAGDAVSEVVEGARNQEFELDTTPGMSDNLDSADYVPVEKSNYLDGPANISARNAGWWGAVNAPFRRTLGFASKAARAKDVILPKQNIIMGGRLYKDSAGNIGNAKQDVTVAELAELYNDTTLTAASIFMDKAADRLKAELFTDGVRRSSSTLRRSFDESVHRYLAGAPLPDGVNVTFIEEMAEHARDFLKTAETPLLDDLQTVAGSEKIKSMRAKGVDPKAPQRANDTSFLVNLRKYGDDAVTALFKRGIANKSRATLDDGTWQILAKSYVGIKRAIADGSIRKANTMKEFEADLLKVRDKLATGEDTTIDEFIESMLDPNADWDEGGDILSSLQAQLKLDHSAFIDTPEGRLSVSDFFDYGFLSTSMQRAQTMNGMVALNKVYGVKTLKDVKELIEDYRVSMLEGVHDGRYSKGYADKMSAEFELSVMAHLGRSTEDTSSPWTHIGRILRNINFVDKGAWFAANALTDVAMMTDRLLSKTVLKRSPVDKLRKAVKNGELSSDDAINIVYLGLGQDLLKTRHFMERTMDATDSASAGSSRLERASDASRYVADKFSRVTGQAFVSTLNKNLVAGKFHSLIVASLKEGKSQFTLNELRYMGFEDASEFMRLAEYVKGRSNVVDGEIVDYGDLTKWDQRMTDALSLATKRYVDKFAQRNTDGDLPPLMDSVLGKMMGQFQSFVMAALGNHGVYALNAKDSRYIERTIASMVVAQAVYVARVQLSSVGMEQEAREKYLEEKLSDEAIITATIMYSPTLGSALSLVGSIANLVGLGDQLAAVRSSGIGIGSIAPVESMLSLAGAPDRIKDALLAGADLDDAVLASGILPAGNAPILKGLTTNAENTVKDLKRQALEDL